MANVRANRTLSGSFAEVWVDGAKIAELSELTLTIKLQREEVQLGMDVDSKITGYAGEGTMSSSRSTPGSMRCWSRPKAAWTNAAPSPPPQGSRCHGWHGGALFRVQRGL